MPGSFIMKMHLNNKQINTPSVVVVVPPPPPPIKNNFNLRTIINAPMRSTMLQNAGKVDYGCGCGGRH